MRRRDQVEVVTALLLQVHHHVGQPLRPDAVAEPALTQREVLAIGAARLAVAEEDRACTARAADGWLFAAVNIPRGDDGLGSRATYAGLTRDTIALTVLRADSATAQDFPRGCGTFCQLARFVEL